MIPNEIILVAGLVILALFASMIGFPFWPSLGFGLALGLVFYLIQGSTAKKSNTEDIQS